MNIWDHNRFADIDTRNVEKLLSLHFASTDAPEYDNRPLRSNA
jgi:hypothetical protein